MAAEKRKQMMTPEPLEQRIDRLFADHRDSVGRLGAKELRAVAQRFDDGSPSSSQSRRLCVWAGRLVLCLLAATAVTATLSTELIVGGYATQSTDWLAAYDLALQKLLRRVSHGLRLYDTELGRGLRGCLLANPFGKKPLVCCDCRQPRISRLGVSSGNLSATVNLIDLLYNRAVTPFLLTGPPMAPPSPAVDFARLARFVAEHRPEFERGDNEVQTLATAKANSNWAAPTVGRFSDLFPAAGEPPTESPPGQLLLWSFSHLSAVRALRHLVPRPACLGPRAERLQTTSLLIAGRGSLPDGLASVGDFPGQRALAYAAPLSGRLMVRLSQKAACCGSDAAASELVTLEPGSVLFFPTDCYELLVGSSPQEPDESAALVYFGFLYNGAHQAQRKKNVKETKKA